MKSGLKEKLVAITIPVLALGSITMGIVQANKSTSTKVVETKAGLNAEENNPSPKTKFTGCSGGCAACKGCLALLSSANN